jgi:GxxExxY protein
MKEIEDIAKDIVHCAVNMHKALGPGLLESVYQQCLAYDLQKAGHMVACEVPLPVTYKEVTIELGFRIDMLIDQAVIVENKTVEKLLPIYPVK